MQTFLKPASKMAAVKSVVILWTLCLSLHQVQPQNCQVDSFTVQENFDFDKYMGRWYIHQWYNKNSASSLNNYIQAYVPIGIGNATVYTEGSRNDTGECQYITAQLTTTSSPGKLHYSYDKMDLSHWVFETDYNQYSFVYRCNNITDSGTCSDVVAWVFGRTSSMPESVKNKAMDFYEKICVGKDEFTSVSHENRCPPKIIVPLSSKENCQMENLPMTDFDADKTEGVWYEIAWLPINRQPAPTTNEINDACQDEQGNMMMYTRRRDSAKCTYEKRTFKKTNIKGKYTAEEGFPTIITYTDYKNFGVIYTCLLINSTTGECTSPLAHIWSRKRSISPAQQYKANRVLQEMCINPAEMEPSVQTDGCPVGESKCPEASESAKMTSSVAVVFLASLLILFTT